MQPHHIGVLQLLEKDDLSVGPLGVSRMLKGIEYLLQGQGLAAFLVCDFPDDPVGPTSHLLQNGVSFKNMSFHFF